jgi:hypothetical protein
MNFCEAEIKAVWICNSIPKKAHYNWFVRLLLHLGLIRPHHVYEILKVMGQL